MAGASDDAPPSNDRDLELTLAEQDAWNCLDEASKKQLLNDMLKLHRTTGHRPPRAMVRTLRKRGAGPATMAAVKQLKCDSCHEG
eukprot:3307671-Lingulodinium_polyedra.AAC.1